MRKEFIEHLISSGVVQAGDAEHLGGVLRGAPEPIGSIAFSYGMITGADIDTVLRSQRENHEPFGQIAVGMGMLSRAQLDALLKIQQMRAATEIAEALALSAYCTIDDVMSELGAFLAKYTVIDA